MAEVTTYPLLALWLCACGPITWFEVRSPSGTLVQQTAPAGVQRYFSLDPIAVPQAILPACLNGLTAALQTDLYEQSRTGELDLFPFRASEAPSVFEQMSDNDILAGKWDQAVADLVTNPSVVVLNFPASAAKPLAPTVVSLSASRFFATPPTASTPIIPLSCTRSDQNGVTENSGRLVAAALYQHGMCAKKLNMSTAVLPAVVDGLWSEFVNAKFTSNHVQKYTKAVSFLGRPQPTTAQADAAPAFYFAFHYSVDVLSVGRDVWGLWRVAFGLVDGFVTATPIEVRMQSSSWDPSSGALSVVGTMRDKILQRLPAQVAKQAPQVVEIAPFNPPCDTPAECGPAAGILAAFVTDKMAAAAGFQPTPSANELEALRCTVGESASCPNQVADLSRSWACELPSDADLTATPKPTKVCQAKVRVKRLNGMPDEIEAVLYDGFESDNLAVALRLAAQAKPALLEMLCSSAKQTTNFDGSFVRHFASASRP